MTGAGFHTARASATAAATANGNRRYFRSSEAGLSVTARSADGTGSGYYAGDHFDLARLDSKHIAEQAVGKAVRSREPKPIEPGVYPVILEPQAVADLIGFLTNSFDARTADEGRSAFSAKDGKTRVGEKLFNERISLYSDPMHPELPAVPSTSEGIPASRLSLIKSGVLENLEYSRFWAQERKREPTPGPVNYIMESAQPAVSTDDMIKGMQRGLLISRFWYVRLVDPRTIVLTGLTRDGLWWIDKGKISHPVRNLRFNQSVLAMLAPWNVDAIGAPAAAVAADGAGPQAERVHLYVDLRRDLKRCRAIHPHVTARTTSCSLSWRFKREPEYSIVMRSLGRRKRAVPA